MGTKCTACGKIMSEDAVHMPKECPHCHTKDRTKFIRTDDEDNTINPEKHIKDDAKHLKDKKYLEGRRAN
jgi:predicted  nucleic acid-binding Zn-ribbon protein